MRFLALDIGDVRIGIAISDELEMAAYPLLTYVRQGSLKRDVAALSQTAAEQEVDAIVVGLPTSLDGSEGPQAKKTRGFASSLASTAKLPLILWDESMSSVDAEERMLALDFSRAKRKSVRDQWAAVIILETYLEHRKNTNVRRDSLT
jgi:putative Holliday junction resolvase